MGTALSDARILLDRRREDGRPHPAGHGQARRALDRRRHQFLRRRHDLRPQLGRHRAPPVPAFRAVLLSGHRLRDPRTSSSGSKPARKASTSSRAAICRRPPIPRISSPIRPCGGRSPSTWRASAPMCEAARRGACSGTRRSARIWSNKSRIRGKRCRATIRTTSSPRSCAANCPATRSTRTTRRSPSSTSCRARPAIRWCCRRRRPATFSTSPAADLAHVMKVAQKVAKAAMTAFAADGITIQQFNEGAGGQVVFHLHVHVIPRKAACR